VPKLNKKSTLFSFLRKNDIESFDIKDSKIIIKFRGHIIESDFNIQDFDKTNTSLRQSLDKYVDDIELKEGLIFEFSRNWSSIIEECLPNPINTCGEWKSGLNLRYADLKQTIKELFPELWETVEIVLSVKSILNIKDITLPFACIILGPPSSSKTVGIELLRDTPNTFYTDSFSAKSFVSHNTSVPRNRLQEIDLLPKIKNNLFLSPELSPTFSKKDEELIETLGILIRVLDGKGYESDSGAQGHRGYTGEYMFTWLGAAVEISRRVHKHLSTLGPKLYFYRLSKISKTEDEYIRLLQGENFGDRVQKIKVKMTEYLEWFDRYPLENHPNEQYQQEDEENEINSVVKVEWNKKRDEKKALEYIVKLAGLLAHLRGTLQTWETRDTQGVDYAYTIPIIEERGRAVTQLYNLARGHALSQGRNFITIEDISLIIKVVLSTASIERVKVFDLLLERGGRLSTSQITRGLTTSNPTARRTIAEFKGLEIVNLMGDLEEESNQHLYDNTEKTMILRPEFGWFLSEEFRKLREEYTPDLEYYFANNHSKIGKGEMNTSELKEKIPPTTTKILKKTSNSSLTIFKNHYSQGPYQLKNQKDVKYRFMTLIKSMKNLKNLIS